MAQQIDPRLYNSGSGSASQSHSQPYDPSTRLPRIDQTHQLPPLSSSGPLAQPYYRLPAPASHSSQSPMPPDRLPDSMADPYTQARYPPERDLHHPPYPTDPSASSGGPAAANADPNDPKRPRACEACRGLKVRCDRDESQPSKPCKRCWKAKRNCIVTAPSRKRQKKTDSRVAELEKKIDALTKSLHAQNAEGQLSPPQSTHSTSTATMHTPPGAPSWHRSLEDRTVAQRRNSRSSQSREPSIERAKRRHIEQQSDVDPPSAQRPRSSRTDDSDSASSGFHSIDMNYMDNIIEPDTATKVFDRYVADMAQHLPAVTFESNTTASEIRNTRPVLFLAILDAASVGMLGQSTQHKLNKMLLDVFASSIVRNGEKSLDLIQALMVSTIWYRQPTRFEQMNIYLLTHMSALMALDFGMGKKLNAPRNWRIATLIGQAPRPQTFLNSDSVEARRTWLGCYFQCMTVSLSMRRPNFIRWNSYLEECVKVLESAPEALPSDKRLCQIVKLMHINEEVSQRFSMDDPSATIAITDPRVQFAITSFEERLEEWTATTPRDLWDPLLEFSRFFCSLYIHEVALHHNHNVDDFRAPFTEESLKAPSLQARHITPYHAGLLQQCLASCHGMLQTFCTFDIVTVKAMPVFYFVRVAYAVVILIKLHHAVMVPNSNLPIKEADLQVELHLDSLLTVLHKIAKEEALRPAMKFLLIIGRLRDGFHKTQDVKKPSSSEPSREDHGNRNSVPSEDRDQRAPRSQPYASGQPRRKSSDQLSSVVNQPKAPSPPQLGDATTFPIHRFNSSQAQSPLHFLSEVATHTHPEQAHLAMQHAAAQAQPGLDNDVQRHQMVQQTGWYQPPDPLHINTSGSMVMSGFGQDYGASTMDPGFEQAVDLTLGIGEGDLSSLFMEDSNFYGFPPPGMGTDGGVNVNGMGLYGGHGGW